MIRYLSPLAPVLVAVVTLVGGSLVYWWQKSLDRENQILQERRQLYRKFVNMVQQVQLYQKTRNKEQALQTYPDFKLVLAELLVTAPDHVVEPLKKLDKSFSSLLLSTFGTSDSETNLAFSGATNLETYLTDFNKCYETAILEMRRDTFRSTNISTFATGLLTEMTSSVLGISKGAKK